MCSQLIYPLKESSVVCVLNCQMHAYIKMGHLMLSVVLSWRFVYFNVTLALYIDFEGVYWRFM